MKSIILSLIAAPAARKSLVRNALFVGTLALAVGLLATPALMQSANAEDARVAKAMVSLQSQTAKLGAPRLREKTPLAARMLLLCISARPK